MKLPRNQPYGLLALARKIHVRHVALDAGSPLSDAGITEMETPRLGRHPVGRCPRGRVAGQTTNTKASTCFI